jgi:hypothetical protein
MYILQSGSDSEAGTSAQPMKSRKRMIEVLKGGAMTKEEMRAVVTGDSATGRNASTLSPSAKRTFRLRLLRAKLLKLDEDLPQIPSEIKAYLQQAKEAASCISLAVAKIEEREKRLDFVSEVIEGSLDVLDDILEDDDESIELE